MFTTYGDVGEVITGNIARAFNNPSITTSFVIFILAIWGIVSYLIAHVVFIKKDILI
jgi:ABC-2 type transport system permease protein